MQGFVAKMNFKRLIEGVRRLSTAENSQKITKLYSSGEKILVVGDGDFSFSKSLAFRLGNAADLTATGYDKAEKLEGMYKEAGSNIDQLVNAGATVYHTVDAMTMADDKRLNQKLYNKVVFNQPYAVETFGNDGSADVIRANQELIIGFFKNAVKMIDQNGEVHISNRVQGDFEKLKIRELANANGLMVINEIKFPEKDYPEYVNKKGVGQGADETFKLQPSSTLVLVKKNIQK